jgi:hypothetical protein
MPYPFYLTIQLTDPGETVVDGAEYVTNGEANQHENPQNSKATKTRLRAYST